MDTTSPLTAERDPREVVAEQIKRETISNALAPTVAATLTTNPDQEAELNRMSRQAGLPRIAVEADKEEVARRIKLEAMGLETMPRDYPALAESLTDPNFAALAHDDIDNLRRLHSAIDFTRQPSTQSSTFDSMAANFSMQNADLALIAYAFGHGDSASVANYVAGENRVLDEIQKNSPAYVRQLEQDKQQAEGLGGYALAYLQNPRASGRAALESLAGSAYTLGGTMIGAGGGAAAGSVVPGVGTTVGGIGGMAVGTATMSAVQNSAAWLRQRLQEQNVNLSDPIAVKAALDNPELVAEIKAEAVRKGVVQGVLDGMFAVVGGKLATAPLSGAAGRVLSGTAGRVVGRAGMAAADVLVQSAGGAGSEAAGQIAARGYADPKDVVDEFVLGTFSEGVDTAVGAAVRSPSFLQNRGVVNAAQVVANEHRAQVDQLHAAAAGAKTRERDPEAVRAMVSRQDPTGEVFIQPDVAKTYFQSLPPEQKAALTQAIPDLEQRIDNAVDAGADVVLPKADYVAHIAAMPEAEFLKDHVKFYADDQTVAEIMSDDRLRQMQNDIEAMGNRQDDIEQFQNRLKNEILDTGRVHGNRVVNAMSDIYGAYFNRLRVDNVSDEVISKAMNSLEVIGPDAKPRPRVVTEADADINKIRDYVMDNDQKSQANEKRYKTRLAEYERRVREDFGGNEGNAQMAGVKRPKFGTGGKKTVKYPMLNFLRKRGGIHPDGELAAFLREEEITPNKMPSLFNRKERSSLAPGGIMSGDGIPITELESYFDGKVSVPVEYGEAYGRSNTRENSSVPTWWLHDAIRSELHGDPVVQEEIDPETQRLETDAEYFDRLGIDVKNMTNEQVRAALAEANGDPVMGMAEKMAEKFRAIFGATPETPETPKAEDSGKDVPVENIEVVQGQPIEVDTATLETVAQLEQEQPALEQSVAEAEAMAESGEVNDTNVVDPVNNGMSQNGDNPISSQIAQPTPDAITPETGIDTQQVDKSGDFIPPEKADKPVSGGMIDDFGEKIEGARKDVWKDYQKSMTDELPDDIKDITLSKHFPEPAYEQMIANGVPVDVLAAIKAMRDYIPAKPRKSWKLTRWAAEVKLMRDFSNKLISGSIPLEKVMERMNQNGNLFEVAERIRLYGELGYPAFTQASEYRIIDIEKAVDPKDWNKGRTKAWAVVKGGSFIFDAPERDSALEYLRAKLSIEPEGEKVTRQVKLDIYQMTATGEIIIGKKVGTGKYVDLKGGFKNAREARAYLKENEKALLVLLERKKDMPPERKSVNDPRIGTDYRKGENVTPEKFAAEFGFRGVQFGNYVEQGRRAEDLNNAYDALLDLSNAIGIPSRAVSLEGKLALAFGARGKGGKNAAMAHYEPTNVVINLTKNAGAGSLGHEWWHALDNYFGKKQDQQYLTDSPRQRMKAGEDKKLVPYDTIRPEMVTAFADLMAAIKKTDMQKRSVKADSTRSKAYWATDIEMSARAFEAWLVWKAAQDGKSSDYLANIVDPAVYEAVGDADRYPYPLPDEMANTIAPAFENLFKSLKTKTADDGITTILYQSLGGEDGARGATKFTVDGRRIIQLFGSSNLSTFLHETGHAFLDIHASIAEMENAPAKVKEDMEGILKFLGADSYAAVTTEQHEKFARTFEAYLASGEAPSAGLHRAFRLFKAWLTQIYAALTGRYADVVKALDTEITPEIKAIFDRMLATDEEVEAVGKTFGHFIDEDVLAILPKADRDRYQRLHSQAMEQAKEKLLSKALRQKERESAQWWKDERAKLHDDVEKSVNSDPVYRAIHWLQKGQFLPSDDMAVPTDSLKLSRQEVVKMFGREIAAKLPSSVYAKKGVATIRPDTLSDLVGFNIGNPLEGWRRGSGRELLLAMANAEDRKARIERLTDETMVERHGDLMMDGTIGDEAQTAAENDFQAMRIEMEGRAAAELAKLKFPSASNMKSAAQKMILEMKIQDAAAVDRFYRSALKSARLYGQAIKGKDWAKAVRYKRQQLLSHFLYREALEARDIRDKSLGVWQKYLGRKDEKLAKSNDMNFVYVARAILSKYGVLSFNEQWEEFVRKVEQYDPEAAQDLVQLANENTVGAMPWRVMTYSQFIGLRDTIDNILGVGRNSRFMEIDGQKRDRAEVRQELITKLAERVAAGEGSGMSDGMSRRLTDKERAMLKLLGAKAMARRVESWTKALDGGFGGVFRSYLWNPINNARDNYYQERHKVFTAAKEVIDPHKERLLNSGRIEAPELGYTFEDKGELLSAMLNSGNESNFERLLEGRKWTAAGWEKMIQRMERDGTIEKADWELCADLAKVVKSLLPAAQKAHKSMYGYYFAEVKPWDIPTSFGTFTGWYWPVVYDRDLSIQARTFAEGDVLKENNISMFPSTGKGFTQKRVANSPKEPIQLGLNVLSSHIDKVLRFTHLEPAVKDAAKLINHPEFKNAIAQYDPKAWENMLMPWLQRVASQSVELRGKGVEHARIWRTIRHNTSMQTMMLNLLNAMQQVTGFSQSIYAVGPRNIGKALITYMSNPRQLFASMNEASTFMRHRSTVLADHVESQVTDVLINKGRMATVRDAAVRHGYIFQRVVQGFVDTVTWTAAMEKATAGGMSVDEAVRYADSVVRDTQGSNDPTDISSIEASSPFGRMFTMFYTYFNTQANSMLTEVANLRREYSGRELAGRTFYLYMMFVAIPAFAAEAIVKTMKGQLPEDDDDDGTVLDDYLAWFLGSQVRYATAMIPFGGQVLNAVYGSVTDDNPFNDRMTGSPVISTLQSIPDAAKETVNAFEGKGDLSRLVQRNLTALGMLTGLPLGQAGKPVGYVADMLEGDTAPEGPVDLVRGVVAGPPPANRQ